MSFFPLTVLIAIQIVLVLKDGGIILRFQASASTLGKFVQDVKTFE
jgi:hypothetical protein